MTDVVTVPATGCKARRHTPSNDSWRNGCRCPEVVAVHRQWLLDHRGQRVAQVDQDGNCIARKHGGRKAYEEAGCRCPEAVAANERHRVHLSRVYALQWEADELRIKAKTGGRLSYDPRRPWRGGRMAVDRNELFWLLRGMPMTPTRGERMAAAIRLDIERPWVPAATWWEKPRRMRQSDLARHIGCTEATVRRLLADRIKLRGQRTQRRLADRRWKDAVAEAAAGRKDEERRRHERAELAGRERHEEWKLRRTVRAMARAREAVAGADRA